MRTIVIGDIHGCYNELKSLLTKLEANQKYQKGVDRLIFLGDYIDRGKDSKKVIQFIKKLQKDYDNVIALKGNHEDMCVNFFKYQDKTWEFNDCRDTLRSYKGCAELIRDISWIENLPLYYEDEYFIYAHAGINPNKPLDKQSDYDLLWVRESFIYSLENFDKKVVFGHSPAQLVNESDKPYYTYAGNIGIDTGCVFGGCLTALIIEDDEVTGFWQIQKEQN